MTNEIKEILDSLKFVTDNPTLEDEVGDEQVTIINYTELNAEESKRLLDYITNLQEKYKEADNDRHKLFEQKEKAIEYMIKQRDVITDYVHQAKEINEDYLFLDRTSLETFKNIYGILQGEDK